MVFLLGFFELLNKKKHEEGSARNPERTDLASLACFSCGAARDTSNLAYAATYRQTLGPPIDKAQELPILQYQNPSQ